MSVFYSFYYVYLSLNDSHLYRPKLWITVKLDTWNRTFSKMKGIRLWLDCGCNDCHITSFKCMELLNKPGCVLHDCIDSFGNPVKVEKCVNVRYTKYSESPCSGLNCDGRCIFLNCVSPMTKNSNFSHKHTNLPCSTVKIWKVIKNKGLNEC